VPSSPHSSLLPGTGPERAMAGRVFRSLPKPIEAMMMARTKWSGGRRILESTRRPMSGPAECVISRGSPETEFCPAMDAIPAEEASAHPTADPLAGVLTPPSDLAPSMVGLRRAGRRVRVTHAPRPRTSPEIKARAMDDVFPVSRVRHVRARRIGMGELARPERRRGFRGPPPTHY
jgi:hypothetical protein